ncbi:tyrosine-protein phosphatase [Nocardia pseudobrasiliensis]|uniref:Protein-tyrosine phosphatase n=1 Tax=Nocardia pseudobrasiliensis TaxID=45979 RepID=A0A370HKH8_9NOCA|nr:tyrosine-protein phosphatase [Nocardia pseudobrasiliensis]RDI59009.1 protein-tyrosine phosphatase [Nocardia pseudobrasiliensis]
MVHRSVRVTAAAAASVALAFGPAVGTALAVDPPAATSSVVSGLDDRSLHLQGVLNARDLGGYRTTDGRVVRSGLVFRAGELSKATDADLAALSERRVRYVDDLRMGVERAIAPDRIPAGAQGNWDDIIGQAPPQVMASAFAAGPDLYRAFITAPGANQGFADVLHDILSTDDGAVLYHCTAGKDRTGWMSAVLLTVLGVDRQTVTYDYLLSNFYRNAGPNDGLNGVVPAALDAAFDQVNQTYGSFDNYVHEGLKLTDDDITALRAELLS